MIRANHRRDWRFQSPHFEEDEGFLISSEPEFFIIVSFPDEAALTVCCSIERLILALRSYTDSGSKLNPTNLFSEKRERGEEGETKTGGSRPYLFQGSNFYRLCLFRRDVSFPFLHRRRGRSRTSSLLLRGLHALNFPLSHDPFCNKSGIRWRFLDES